MNKDLSQDTQEKITQLQMLEQNMQNTSMQKQQLNSQLIEMDSALKELGNTTKAYKIVGNIMVSAEKSSLESEIKQKKDLLELKIKTLEKQEERFREKAQSLQEEVMKKIKKEE